MTILTIPDSDSCTQWCAYYLGMVVRPLRSTASTTKLTLHLERFQHFLLTSYGPDDPLSLYRAGGK